MGLDLSRYAYLPRGPAVKAMYARYEKKKRVYNKVHDRQVALAIIGTGIGNIIEQTPMLTAIASMYRHLDVFLPISTPAAASVIKGMPRVRRIFIYKRGMARLMHRRNPYSAIFATYLVNDFAFRLNRRSIFMSGDFTKQEAPEAIICMQAAIAAGYRGKVPAVWCRQEEWHHTLPSPKCVGITGGGLDDVVWQHKRYPNYLAVVDYVVQRRPDVRFVNIGTLSDTEIPHPAVLDLRGLTTLGQSATIASRCDVYLANDCGMAHVAAAMGTSTVVVFGPTKVLKNLPYKNATPIMLDDLPCRPCQYSKPGIGRLPRSGRKCRHECMQQLDPVTVGEAVLAHL